MMCDDKKLYNSTKYPTFAKYCVGSYMGTFEIGLAADLIATWFLVYKSKTRPDVIMYRNCASSIVPLKSRALRCYGSQLLPFNWKNAGVNLVAAIAVVVITFSTCTISHSVITSSFTTFATTSDADKQLALIDCPSSLPHSQCRYSEMTGQCNDIENFLLGPGYAAIIEWLITTIFITPMVTTGIILPLGDRLCYTAGNDIQCESWLVPVTTSALSLVITNAIVAGFDDTLTETIIGTTCDPVCKYELITQ